MHRIVIGLIPIFAGFGAHAALLGRLPATPGGTDYQAVYDTDLDITWLANPYRGGGDWDTAQSWITMLNTTNYLGVSNWRLPTTKQPDSSCHLQNPAPARASYGWGCTGGELGHLFYSELGGTSGGTVGNNLFGYFYDSPIWSGTSFASDPSYAWRFNFYGGYQDNAAKSIASYAWPVRPGDIGLVQPPPAANIAVTDSVAPYNDFTIPFGTAAPGQRIIRTVTITNNGNADLLFDQNLQYFGSSLRPPFSLDWPYDNDNDCHYHGTIQPSTTCTLQVLFAPTAVSADFGGVLVIASNDSDTPSVSISVSGTSQTQRGAPLYTITDLGKPPGYSISANSINDRGEIAGSQCVEAPYPNNYCHAVRWSPGGSIQDLGTLGGNSSGAYEINNAGAILGSSKNAADQGRQFIWTASTGMTDLASVTGGTFDVSGMNDVGQFVGTAYLPAEDTSHIHVWSPATGDVDLGIPPNAYYSYGLAINNLGVVLATSHSSVWVWTSNSGFTKLHDPKFPAYIYAGDINDEGVVVGNASYSAEGDVPDHAYRWTASTGMQDLAPGIAFSSAGTLNRRGDMLGWGQDNQFFNNDNDEVSLLWTAEGEMFTLDGVVTDMTGWQTLGGGDINNRGQILGFGIASNGERHAVLLIPILPDADVDEFPDRYDNCLNVSNPDQYDADNDGYGNKCDADLNNSGTVTTADYTILRNVLNQLSGSSAIAAAADLNGSGRVTTTDYTILRNALNAHPGPSGLHPNCPPTCP